jgi:hypothetical protein
MKSFQGSRTRMNDTNIVFAGIGENPISLMPGQGKQ